LVRTLISKKVIKIAAGVNHSLLLTQQGDVYASGHGQAGQLGLREKNSKTHFVHLASLLNKNVLKVFAGGNHSWLLLDDLMPLREFYKAPSPVKPDIKSPKRHSSRSKKRVQASPLSKSSKKIAFTYQVEHQLRKPHFHDKPAFKTELRVQFVL